MGAGHSHALYVHEHSPIHRLAPEAKVIAAFGIVASIAVTPRHAVWAFGIYAGLVLMMIMIARIRIGFVGARLLAILPFVAFALFIPFVASGQTAEIFGIAVSVDGLWGMWSVLAKAILGASVSILLTATTEIPDIIKGLGALRVPATFTAIAMFMVRYLELVVDELRRMRVAMTSRGYDPSWLSQARPLASSAGALFVRSFERGERVHSAMLSRGFTGTMPEFAQRRPGTSDWAPVIIVVALAALIAVSALVTS